MMINMMQTVIKNSVSELASVLYVHMQFTPPKEALASTELDVTIEPPRPEGVPELPLFIVDVVLKPTALALDPSRTITKNIFKQVMNLWEEYLTGVRSLIGDDTYQPFTKYVNSKLYFCC